MFKNVNRQQTTDNRLSPQLNYNFNGKKAHCSQFIAQS